LEDGFASIQYSRLIPRISITDTKASP
jgi:hypothetical protein